MATLHVKIINELQSLLFALADLSAAVDGGHWTFVWTAYFTVYLARGLCHYPPWGLISDCLNWLSKLWKSSLTPWCYPHVSCRACTTGNLPCHGSFDQYYTIARMMSGDLVCGGYVVTLPLSECRSRTFPLWCRTWFACSCISHVSYINVNVYLWLCACLSV